MIDLIPPEFVPAVFFVEKSKIRACFWPASVDIYIIKW